MAITKIPAAGFTGNNFRNIIINGDMSIAQRSTSVASITGSGYYTLDRFQTSIGTAGTWTQSQSTDVPTGQGFATSLKMDCTTANGSLSSGSELVLRQMIEGQNLQYLKKGTANAESITMSFWVKSNKTGTYICEIDDNDNSRNINKSYTINSANTWEKKTITFAGDTTGTLDNDNGSSFRIMFWLAAGSNFTSGTLATSWESTTNTNRAVGQVNLADSTSNDWYVTGVQLEAGTTASDFEFLPYDVNLRRCMRYYEKSYEYATAVGTSSYIGKKVSGGNQGAATTSYISGDTVDFMVEKRANPTVTVWDREGNVNKVSRFTLGVSTNHNQSLGSAGDMSTNNFTVYSDGSSSNNGLQYHWRAVAEL